MCDDVQTGKHSETNEDTTLLKGGNKLRRISLAVSSFPHHQHHQHRPTNQPTKKEEDRHDKAHRIQGRTQSGGWANKKYASYYAYCIDRALDVPVNGTHDEDDRLSDAITARRS